MKTTRYTAANSKTLRAIKDTFNAAVYREALRRANEAGRIAAIDYVVTYYRAEVRAEKRAALVMLGS